MKNSDFLSKLIAEKNLEIVECSEEMSHSYEKKSAECREVAKLAFNNNYFESAVTQSYYSMYNAVLSLFFKCGIKCENHSGTLILLKNFFSQNELYLILSKSKVERIDKQYYTSEAQTNPLTKESANEIIISMMAFNPKLISFKNSLSLKEIEKIRSLIKEI